MEPGFCPKQASLLDGRLSSGQVLEVTKKQDPGNTQVSGSKHRHHVKRQGEGYQSPHIGKQE